MTKNLKLFVLLIFVAGFILSAPIVLAQSDSSAIQPPTIHVNIGSFTGWGTGGGISKGSEYCPSGSGSETECIQVSWLSDYIIAVYKYGVILAAVLATVVIMVGGLLWLMSGGSPDKIGKAKTFIGNALLGLILTLFSYMILYTINPALVRMSPLTVSSPKEVVFKPSNYSGSVDQVLAQAAEAGASSSPANKFLTSFQNYFKSKNPDAEPTITKYNVAADSSRGNRNSYTFDLARDPEIDAIVQSLSYDEEGGYYYYYMNEKGEIRTSYFGTDTGSLIPRFSSYTTFTPQTDENGNEVWGVLSEEGQTITGAAWDSIKSWVLDKLF